MENVSGNISQTFINMENLRLTNAYSNAKFRLIKETLLRLLYQDNEKQASNVGDHENPQYNLKKHIFNNWFALTLYTILL